ncbi:hypothetical protein AXW83_02820 [Bosea sp. PAMC 26642]|nr:hypothetical protein AXW83_02820 [Bosea sp. PAMC 26642]
MNASEEDGISEAVLGSDEQPETTSALRPMAAINPNLIIAALKLDCQIGFVLITLAQSTSRIQLTCH